MSVEEIIKDLNAGKDVQLEDNKVYDFTGIHSIPVKSKLSGKATIISNSLFTENETSNPHIEFLFDALPGSSFEDIKFIGPNGSMGDGSDSYWGAIRVFVTSTINNCSFEDCDKWAIRIDARKVEGRTIISNCNFKNIQRLGYGYAIWNQYGKVTVFNCDFEKCRHGLDTSGCESEYYIDSCNFNEGNNIYINTHAYINDTHGGNGITIINCSFLDMYQPMQLKYPCNSSKKIQIINNRFAGPANSIGIIANKQILNSDYNHPQVEIRDNVFNGDFLVPKSEIIADSDIYIDEKFIVSSKNTAYSYNWSMGNSNINVPNVLSPTIISTKNPRLLTMSLYVTDKAGNRSPKTYKTIKINALPGKDYFGFAYSGYGCYIDVICNEKVIDTIYTTKTFSKFKNKIYFDQGLYKLKIYGEGEVLIDDWVEDNFAADFEQVIKLKVKYNLNGGEGIAFGLKKGSANSGNGSVRIRIGDNLGNIILNNNVDKF